MAGFKLFILKDGLISLNNDEILLFKEFAAILERDTSPGRTVGYNQFKYIYHICDPKSYPNKKGLNEKKAHEWATKECGFNENWKPQNDIVLLKALKKYAELRSSLIAEICQEILISISSTIDVLRVTRTRSEKLLAMPELSIDNIKEVRNLQKEVIEMASGIPNLIKKIEEAEKELETSDEAELLRGKQIIPDSMKPEEAIG